MYPTPIRRWITHRGGLTPRMIFLHGKELQSMYRPCYLDAQASSNAPAGKTPPPATVVPVSASGAAASAR
jgi:hypothetical protein